MSHPAARSVHLWFDLPQNAKCVCNEVCVTESQKGTYFCVIGFSRGYSGIQELYDGKKMAIFSVWDSETNTDPSEDKRVQVIYSGEGVEVSRFGNEGTGGKTMMPYEWVVGEPVQFKLEAENLDELWTAYSCYIKNSCSPDWFHMATMKTITNGELLKGVYSFVEDFRRDGASHCEIRSAKFGDCFCMQDDGHKLCNRAQFTADSSTPLNINAGLSDNKFYLATGGETKNTSTPLNGFITKSSDPE
ncbi:uncharacterized protein LOC133191772 [Saccostrea echinata]|uniref:uncharacterized protein LOC133191772 n=1 Tax=Saccostrea echinata TaxID=191078 RepID=UPI002A83A429|nr:uncharacterized protein LOC133191772 [Saccostrea echinata]